MRKIAVAAVCLLSLSGCYKPAESAQQQGSFVVERIFTVEGCNVYRFKDSLNYVYTTICPNGNASSQVTYSGKGHSTTYQVDTTHQ